MTEYGYCPLCGAEVFKRERRLNGYDTCDNGHKFLSSEALSYDKNKVREPGYYVIELGGGFDLVICYFDGKDFYNGTSKFDSDLILFISSVPIDLAKNMIKQEEISDFIANSVKNRENL